MKINSKIIVVGMGYVGLANAILLAKHNQVIGLDVSKIKIDQLNKKVSPIEDQDIKDYLTKKKLNLSFACVDHKFYE